MGVVYLNGEFVDQSVAKISVLDRGFLFGDGVYEMIPAYHSRLFCLEQHLNRLQNSLHEVRINNPYNQQQWRSLLSQLVTQNEGADQAVYVQVTRGIAERDHTLHHAISPTVFAMSSPLQADRVGQPVSAILTEDIRWKNCHIKSIALLPNVLLRYQAQDQGAYEAILTCNGTLTEGAASNVFVVSDGVVKTPPKSQALLPGVTRDMVVEVLTSQGIPCEETVIAETELHSADEIWLTSSTREILPVTILDGAAVGSGEPGAMWARATALYQQAKHRSH